MTSREPAGTAKPADAALAALERELLPFFAPAVRWRLGHAAALSAATRVAAVAPPARGCPGVAGVWPWEEIRLRVGRPLLVAGPRGDAFVDREGVPRIDPAGAEPVTTEDVQRTLEIMSGSSLYALETELRQGFLTLPGGHRVGLAGRAVLRDGQVQTMRDIGSLNVRVARAVPGAADQLLPWLLDGEGCVHSTLIFSPPGAGKTTVLRDLARQVSAGRPDLGLPGRAVAVADERSELAGCRPGGPSLDLGPRTDVLDGCPKAEALILLVRSMAPRVVVTDELGRAEDADALAEATRCGVRVLATAHAGSVAELRARPGLGGLVEAGVFRRLVRLGRSRGPGTVEEVWDGMEGVLLYPAAAAVSGRPWAGPAGVQGRAGPVRGGKAAIGGCGPCG